MSKQHKQSLAELMGNAGSQGIQLSRLHEVLGEATPELPRNAVGRHRLIMALNQRFGANFRALPGVKEVVKQFDHEIEFEKSCEKLRAIKYVPSKRED
jgi:hypothetical protein